MSFIPREEWLDQAQALPIGHSKRIYHEAETRPNLVVYNNEDSWSCWCHSCHAGGCHKKTHVVPAATSQRSKGMVPPDDSRRLEDCSERVQMRVAKHLAAKGMDLKMLAGVDPSYSEDHDRLLLRCTGGVIGRALHETNVKWACYRNGFGLVARFGEAPDEHVANHAVLTEDYYSALKVRWACGKQVSAIAILGTHMSDSLVTRLIGKRVTLALDGDAAGTAGTDKAIRRLIGLGIPCEAVSVPAGLDPKDMSRKDLRSLLLGK